MNPLLEKSELPAWILSDYHPNHKIPSLSQGIATPVCRLARNDIAKERTFRSSLFLFAYQLSIWWNSSI